MNTSALHSIWVSDCLSYRSFKIGVNFLDTALSFVEYSYLAQKEKEAQLTGSNAGFTEKDHKMLDTCRGQYIEIWKNYRRFNPLIMEPDSLWIVGRQKQTAISQSIFIVSNGGIVLNAVCAELLRDFRLGKTRLIPLRIYDSETKQLKNEDPYFLLELTEQRKYFIAESNRSEYYSNRLDLSLNYPIYKMPSRGLRCEAADCDVDLWHDPGLPCSVFVSEALHKALDTAGMVNDWQLQLCN